MRQILDDEATPLDGLTASKIGRGIGTATAGIYRVTDRAQTNQGEQTCSAVIKVLAGTLNRSR